VKRVGIALAFQQAKQPARIQQVLETVRATSLGTLLKGAQKLSSMVGRVYLGKLNLDVLLFPAVP